MRLLGGDAVVNALAKAGVDLGENGSVIPRPKGRRSCLPPTRLPAGQGRSDKEYCKDACRMRAYRKRKGKH
jgi:hypothetical protein